jgi:hypothetical protein
MIQKGYQALSLVTFFYVNAAKSKTIGSNCEGLLIL